MRTSDYYRILTDLEIDLLCGLTVPDYMTKLSESFPDYKIYLEAMIDLTRTAKDRCKDLRDNFRSDIEKLTTIEYQLAKLKELARENPTCEFKNILSRWADKIGYGKHYLYSIIAQLDLEEPGYIDNFPDVLKFIQRNRHEKDATVEVSYIYRLGKRYLKSYNRYSDKNDLKCIKNILGIRKEDLEIKKEGKRYYENNYYRTDDYISWNIHKFVLDNKNRKVYRYLLDNFLVQKEDLLPLDYYKIIKESGVEVEDKPTDPNDLDWIEIFFNLQDKIQETLDPRNMKPSTMKLLNRIILSGWK